MSLALPSGWVWQSGPPCRLPSLDDAADLPVFQPGPQPLAGAGVGGGAQNLTGPRVQGDGVAPRQDLLWSQQPEPGAERFDPVADGAHAVERLLLETLGGLVKQLAPLLQEQGRPRPAKPVREVLPGHALAANAGPDAPCQAGFDPETRFGFRWSTSISIPGCRFTKTGNSSTTSSNKSWIGKTSPFASSLDGQMGDSFIEHRHYLWDKYRDRFVIFTNINSPQRRAARRASHLGTAERGFRPADGAGNWPKLPVSGQLNRRGEKGHRAVSDVGKEANRP